MKCRSASTPTSKSPSPSRSCPSSCFGGTPPGPRGPGLDVVVTREHDRTYVRSSSCQRVGITSPYPQGYSPSSPQGFDATMTLLRRRRAALVQSISDMRPEPSRPASGGRVPPHNIEAEESLLGAMLLSKDAIASAVEKVSPEDFYKPAHGHLFEAIQSLYGQGEPV